MSGLASSRFGAEDLVEPIDDLVRYPNLLPLFAAHSAGGLLRRATRSALGQE